MTTDLAETISELLRQAEENKWAYAQIGAFWDNLPDPMRYGERMSLWLPDHDDLHRLLLDTLQLGLPENGRILDLGGGSGRFAQMMLARFPSCHVTLSDASNNMLEAAAQKLAPYQGRYELRQEDFFDAANDFPSSSFDAVVAVFAICHGRSLAQYERLYDDIFRWLEPGGRFLCLDHVLGETEALTALNVAAWYHYLVAHLGEQPARQFILETYQEDFPLPVNEHMRLLGEAYFANRDILYRKQIFGMLTAEKPAQPMSSQ